MGLHGGYDNRNTRERNKNEIVLTKKLSLSRAPIDQNALQFSQIQYGLLHRPSSYRLDGRECYGKKHYCSCNSPWDPELLKNSMYNILIDPEKRHAY